MMFAVATTGITNWQALGRFLLLRDYNTRIVVTGAILLGIAAGLAGVFMLLRKRALIGDALSHATLPGIALAFMFATVLGGDSKSLPLLLTGAAATGLFGILLVLALRHSTRIKEDSAMGIILSVFFGLGIALLGIAQRMEQGHSAGLESFIYGKTASMVASDAAMIAGVALFASILSMLLYKEFRLLCFDQAYAKTQGWPVMLLDILLMAMVTLVTVIGLQAVGLVLVIALLVIPAAAARFWTQRLWKMLLISALCGAISCYIGTLASALLPNFPAGAMIVLSASLVFAVSMAFGPANGVFHRIRIHRELQRKTARQNVLRAIFEIIEPTLPAAAETAHIPHVTFAEMLGKRTWSPAHLRRLLHGCIREGLVVRISQDQYRPTLEGLTEARHVARQHRLWELYLITHADVATNHVDRSADMIEHIIGTEMAAELEGLLEAQAPPVIASPHRINHPEEGGGHVAHA